MPYQAIWGLVDIEARETVGEESEHSWILTSGIHGLIALEVYLLRAGGKSEQLLAHDIRLPFSARDYSLTRLRSAPVTLVPGERATLAVRMVHGAIEEANFALEEPSEHLAAAFADVLKLAGFYAFLGACLLFFFVFSLAMRSLVEFAYALLLLLGLGFVAYLDNFPFRWLYPDHPDWHLPVGLVLFLILIAEGFFTAGLSIRRYSSEQKHVRLFYALSAAVLASIALVFVLPAEIVAPLSYLLMAAMFATQVYCVFQWDAFDGARRRVVRWVTLVTVLGFSAVVVLAIARTGVGDISIPWFIKGVYATLAFGVMAGLSTGLIELRREHADALAREIEAVRKEAAVTQELLKAEQNYSRVRDLADKRQLQLASMSHDIKQPLSALRMSVEAMTRDDPGATRARLQEAFDYIQDLALSHLDEAQIEAAGESAKDNRDTVQSEAEPYSVSLILDTVGQMFGDEARIKGLSLKVVNSSALVSVQPLALMRIVSNLVSNAIKYTDKGKVLAGVRRRGGRIEIQVLDTGPGMSAEDLNRYRQAWQSGEGSEGHGLGLAICAELAAGHGLSLDAASLPGSGTRFSLGIPLVAATPPEGAGQD
ncbi:sensor histidine kinase [Roseibium sediminicola]|uniref:sensor histidine kinase n=1 Tax=Roseibium sediminicola TaxID=2933272 RepID=UPI002003F9EB